ncbi:MAG: glycosyltransferase family 2 protein [Candidatus Omnitrophica bacterium]|nr:glycosyltransferase family 2 protein [Candidatus Omnitrophota bacterium]
MKTLPEVSAVVLTFNSENFISECLKSLLKQNYPNLKIFVVDNDSQDNTLAILDNFKNIEIIKNNQNIGVCSARNSVIRQISSKYVLTVDSDVILDENFVFQMVSRAENSRPDTGMWGGTVFSMKDSKTIDTLGLKLGRFYRFYDLGSGKNQNYMLKKNNDAIGPCACSALYSKKMLESVNGRGEFFDSEMHYLVEDFDLALRAQNKGWKFQYVAEAVCYHYRHGSNIKSDYIKYLSFKNRYLLILKDFKLPKIPYLVLSLFLYDLPRLVYLLIVNYAYTKKAALEISKIVWQRKILKKQ